jgi:hypothetical protein
MEQDFPAFPLDGERLDRGAVSKAPPRFLG